MTIVKLLGKRFLAERVRSYQEKSSGGVYLPPVAMDDYNTGGPKEYRVLAVSDEIKDFGVGDRVVCQSYTHGATEVEEGKFVLPEHMVIAVLPLKTCD